MTNPSPTPEGCRARQAQLQDVMTEHDLSLVVLTGGESINWLTGVYLGPLFSPTAAIDAEGQVTLVLPQRKLEMPAVADRLVGYEAKWHSTMRDDQPAASIAVLAGAIGDSHRRVGTEFSAFPQHLTQKWSAEWIDVEPALFRLRRHKHADELAIMARANDANRRMYQRAREIIAPGVSELEVFHQLQATAVSELGEPLTYFGQDFRCGERGGPPRQREAQQGELYILDLGVGYRGYHSDNARTIAVGGEPDQQQQAAWHQLAQVFPLIESEIRPGKSCKQLFHQVQQFLDSADVGTFNHHLGHGVGLAPHEGPHLNPHWDDTFAEGDFFTAEPGLYDPQLRQGIRLEQNYVVTATGVKLLTDWPLELC